MRNKEREGVRDLLKDLIFYESQYAVAHWVPVSIHGDHVGLGSLFDSLHILLV